MIIGQGRLDTETAGYEGERKKMIEINQRPSVINRLLKKIAVSG